MFRSHVLPLVVGDSGQRVRLCGQHHRPRFGVPGGRRVGGEALVRECAVRAPVAVGAERYGEHRFGTRGAIGAGHPRASHARMRREFEEAAVVRVAHRRAGGAPRHEHVEAERGAHLRRGPYRRRIGEPRAPTDRPRVVHTFGRYAQM